DRSERVETIAGSSGSSGFSLDISGGGLTLHVGGSGSHGQSEREVKVDGVRTEYRYGRRSSNHHNMSFDFEYADSYVDIDLSAGSHGHSSQSSVEELLPDGRTIETVSGGALQNGSLNWLRRAGYEKITSTLRSSNRHPHRLFTRIGLVKWASSLDYCGAGPVERPTLLEAVSP